MSENKTDVPYGTLDLLILKTLDTMGPMHGYRIARRIEQVAENLLRLNQGSIYPALIRLEATRLDSHAMGNLRDKTQGQVLFADQGRSRSNSVSRLRTGKGRLPWWPGSWRRSHEASIRTVTSSAGAVPQAESRWGAGGRNPGPPGVGRARCDRRRAVAGRGSPRGPPQFRRNRTDEGRSSRSTQRPVGGEPGKRRSIRVGFAGAGSWIRRGYHRIAGSRHRRQHGNVQYR